MEAILLRPAYMPMKSNDDTKIETPAVAPKIATDDDSKVL
jgi:hypothetical protein